MENYQFIADGKQDISKKIYDAKNASDIFLQDQKLYNSFQIFSHIAQDDRERIYCRYVL